MRLPTPPDKRFKRAHVKPGRKGMVPTSWRWRGVALLCLIAAGGYAAHRAVGFIAHLEMFSVRHVIIHGNKRLSNGEVLALIDGIEGENILALDLAQWRGRLMRSPWIADAVLHRTLPS